jgi:diaminohydroxyphosphoribosylaminopyrimidine deaminase/5-amino-6-(5-phosphoribosylamino)uracil reductase
MVGAVLVKNGKIIAEGYHRQAGLPHAEIEAIKKAKVNLNGATLYLNLEPCCHYGKTPPCVYEIIKNKIKRVVISTVDPNPLIKHKSIKILKKAGIIVKMGLLKKEAQQLNEVFFRNMQAGRPFIAAKIAQSLDGKIATRAGLSKWITSLRSRKLAKSLRDKYDCVLVGINTVAKDDPHLAGLKKVPYRVIIDPQLRISNNCFIMRNNPQKTLIFSLSRNKLKIKKNFPAQVFFVKSKNEIIPVKKILKVLYNKGITSVFVEGGSYTLGNFLDNRLIDKFYFFIAPKIIGGSSLSSVGAKGFNSPSQCAFLNGLEITRIGEDLLIAGNVCYGRKKSLSSDN